MTVSLEKLSTKQLYKHVADLTHERDELQRKLATALESVDNSLRVLSAETARNNALAFECHSAKTLLAKIHRESYDSDHEFEKSVYEKDTNFELQDFIESQSEANTSTPATDAEIAEIRAQGVDAFVATLQKHVTEGDFVGDELPVIQGAIDAGGEFAETLRKGSGQ